MTTGRGRSHGQGQGKSATSPVRIAVTERRAEALRRRKAGQTYEEFWAELGYSSRAAAVMDVKRALDATLREPADDVREMELARLDDILARLAEREQAVLAVRNAEHLTVSHGKVIMVPDGLGGEKPLLDDGPVLQANAQLMVIEAKRIEVAARRARYLGLDAPTRTEADVALVPARPELLAKLDAVREANEAARAAGPDE